MARKIVSLALLNHAAALERVDIDTLAFDVLPGDRMLLCSDGLYNYFPDAHELKSYLDTPQSAPERLVRTANERGGEDNISAVVLDVAQIPAALTPAMFACARVAGWSAHILEQKQVGRLIRPSARYVGPGARSLSSL